MPDELAAGCAPLHPPYEITPVAELRPECEAEAGAGAGGGAVARLIERPFEREVLDRASDADPVADLGAAGVELLARQGLDRGAVIAAQHVDKAAVEVLVDDEMAES